MHIVKFTSNEQLIRYGYKFLRNKKARVIKVYYSCDDITYHVSLLENSAEYFFPIECFEPFYTG